MKLSHKAFGLGMAAAVAAAGCAGRQAPPPQGPVEVSTVTVHAERVLLTTELPGRTCAYLVAEIRPQVNGIIQKP